MFFCLPAKNDDRIPDLTFFIHHPPRMIWNSMNSIMVSQVWVRKREREIFFFSNLEATYRIE
jgi:hypothetical protein